MAQKKADANRIGGGEGDAGKRHLHGHYKPENGPASSASSWARALRPLLFLATRRADWRVHRAVSRLWRRHIGGAS